MAPILRKVRAISVSRTARVFVDGGASIGISVMFGLSSLPDGYRFKRPVYRPFKDSYVAKMACAPAERLLPRHADILEHKIIPFHDFREVSPLATALGPKTEKRRQLRSQPAPPKTGNRVRVEGGY